MLCVFRLALKRLVSSSLDVKVFQRLSAPQVWRDVGSSDFPMPTGSSWLYNYVSVSKHKTD